MGIGLDGDAIAVYCYLLLTARGDGYAFPKLTTIADNFGWRAKNTVRKKLEELEEKGVILIEPSYSPDSGRQTTNNYVLYTGQEQPSPPSPIELAELRRGRRCTGEGSDSVKNTMEEGGIQPPLIVDVSRGSKNCTPNSSGLKGSENCTGEGSKNCTPLTQSSERRIPRESKDSLGGRGPRRNDLRSREGRQTSTDDQREETPTFDRVRRILDRVVELTQDSPRGAWDYQRRQVTSLLAKRVGFLELIEGSLGKPASLTDEELARIAAFAWRTQDEGMAPTWDSIIRNWATIRDRMMRLPAEDPDSWGAPEKKSQERLNIPDPVEGIDYERKMVTRVLKSRGVEMLLSRNVVPGTDREFNEDEWRRSKLLELKRTA